MTTLSITLEDRLSAWLRARSTEAGITPEALVEETLRKQEISERLAEITRRTADKAAARGLTEETLEALLRKGDD